MACRTLCFARVEYRIGSRFSARVGGTHVLIELRSAMSVTVVGRWQVPDGCEEDSPGRASYEFSVRGASPVARRQAQIFQSLEDRRAMLYVGEWTSRSAFDTYCHEGGQDTAEVVVQHRGELVICERAMFFGNYAYRVQVTGCAVFEAAPDGVVRLLEHILPGGRWALHGAPGLVRYTVYREVGRAQRYIIVHGWQSASGLEATEPQWTLLESALAAEGASLTRFIGRESASTDPL